MLFPNIPPPFNPFIYDTQTRGHETHLIHSPPTGRHNPQFFKQDDDDSQPQLGKYYHTVNGLPWGLNLSGDWEHPKEGINIDTAYPEILDWAQSQGATHTNWYLNPSLDKIW